MMKRTEQLANIQTFMNVLYYYVIGIIVVCHYFYSGCQHEITLKNNVNKNNNHKNLLVVIINNHLFYGPISFLTQNLATPSSVYVLCDKNIQKPVL